MILAVRLTPDRLRIAPSTQALEAKNQSANHLEMALAAAEKPRSDNIGFGSGRKIGVQMVIHAATSRVPESRVAAQNPQWRNPRLAKTEMLKSDISVDPGLIFTAAANRQPRPKTSKNRFGI